MGSTLVAVLLVTLASASALFAASALRLSSPISFLLAAYVACATNLGVTTLVLSPLHAVTRTGLGLAEGVLTAAAVAVWRAAGCPPPPWQRAREQIADVFAAPVAALFVVLALAVLGYELVLALTVPPNDLDALTYHLARAAAWAQHGGLFWIPNAPTVRLNAFQPLAEQQILFLFVATGSDALYALPQYVAEIAVLVSVFGSARRLGYDTRAATAAACLLATFSLVALEASTGLNDLVAAAFPAVAVYFLLGSGRAEAVLAGVTVALGVGTKLTTLFALPVVVWLVLRRGPKTVAPFVAGALAGLVTVGMWGYLLNAIHTGHALGVGTGAPEDRASTSLHRAVANLVYFAAASMDESVLSHHVILITGAAGAFAASAIGLRALIRHGGVPVLATAELALPFAAPLIVSGGSFAIASLAARAGLPIVGENGIIGPRHFALDAAEWRHIASSEYSCYGPLGVAALGSASLAAAFAWARRRVDSRELALACAVPIFVILASLSLAWNPYIMRFLVIPAVLGAPLLARLLRRPVVAAGYLAVAAVVAVSTLANDQAKPLRNPDQLGRPWELTQVTALMTNSNDRAGSAVLEYARLVPARACVGAVLGPNEPSYLLYGLHFEHRVFYLSAGDAVETAYRDGLFYVVVSSWSESPVAERFAAAGWHLSPMGGDDWVLASEPRATASSAACSA